MSLLRRRREQKEYSIANLTFANPAYNQFALMAVDSHTHVTICSNGPVSEVVAVQSALAIARAWGVKADDRFVRRLVNNGAEPEEGFTIQFDTGEDIT